MVETIAPVVHGDRRASYLAAAAAHVLGATLAAAALGGLLGGLGMVLNAPWGAPGLSLVALVAGVYALREAGVVRVPVPQRREQVPAWWRTFFSSPVAALLYGLGLGVGFLTYLSYGTLVAVSAAALASGDALVGAALVAPFGAARAVSVAAAHRLNRTDPGEVLGRLEALASSAPLAALNAAALGLVAAAAALAALQAMPSA